MKYRFLLGLLFISYSHAHTVFASKGILQLSLTNKTLTVISAMNRVEPSWYISDTFGTLELTHIPNTLKNVISITASPNDSYILVCSNNEGHPVYDVLATALIISNQSNTYFRIDPYPGDITIVSWDTKGLIVKSDMLLDLGVNKDNFYTQKQPIQPEAVYLFDVTRKRFTPIQTSKTLRQ